MLTALMIKANLDAGETSEDQGVFDLVLLMLVTALKKGKTMIRKYATSRASRAEREVDEESGRQVGALFSSKVTVLGGGGAIGQPGDFNFVNPMIRDGDEEGNDSGGKPTTAGKPPALVKYKAGNGRPNSSFGVFKNGGLAMGGGGGGGSSRKNKKNDGVVVAKLENEIIAKSEVIAKDHLKVDSKGRLAKEDNNV